jgi:hypothetical protein
MQSGIFAKSPVHSLRRGFAYTTSGRILHVKSKDHLVEAVGRRLIVYRKGSVSITVVMLRNSPCGRALLVAGRDHGSSESRVPGAKGRGFATTLFLHGILNVSKQKKCLMEKESPYFFPLRYFQTILFVQEGKGSDL